MAVEGRVYYADLRLPPVPVGRVYHAEVVIPAGAIGRVYHAELVIPAPNPSVGRVYHAELVTPRPPDMPPESGVKQFAGDTWWHTTVRQKTAAGEWV